MPSPSSSTIYNPDLLSKADLIGGFVARSALLAELLDDLHRTGQNGAPQHHLLLGQRGLGKTTLLRRFAYAIADDPALTAIWQPLVFPEEQFNVADLADFWLNCADALIEAFERAGRRAEADHLSVRVEQLGDEPGADAALCLLLAEADRIGRRLVLFVDNIDLVLDRIGLDQEWPFRRLLSEEKRLLVIGASSRALEAFYEHGRAFYDFFQVHELKGLSDADSAALLRHLAVRAGAPEALHLAMEQPARLRTLCLLTGGNPRALALLSRIHQQDGRASAEQDLEQLLDLYTPIFKARFEELPPQAQRVLDAVALNWNPLIAADVSSLTGLAVNAASAQLKRLEDLGAVEKVPWFGEKKTGFQVADRLFNVWYLMRANRRSRGRLIAFVRFLDAWFGSEELLRTRIVGPRDVASSGSAGWTRLPQEARERLWSGASELATTLTESPEPRTLVRAVEACAAATAGGRLSELMAIFRETAAERRWQPLFEAVRAVEAGSADYLRRVAPEIRTAAEPLRALLERR